MPEKLSTYIRTSQPQKLESMFLKQQSCILPLLLPEFSLLHINMLYTFTAKQNATLYNALKFSLIKKIATSHLKKYAMPYVNK